MTSEEIFQLLQEKFPNSNFEFKNDFPISPIVVFNGKNLINITKFLRDNERLLFDSLMNLSGVDDNNEKKIKDSDGSEKLIPGTLSVYYHLHSMKLNHKFTLKVSVQKDNPEVQSVESVWKTADWHEREAFDMFGLKFLNHPNLIRILMPYDWEEGSHPLRKDFKVPEFYNGMKVPY